MFLHSRKRHKRDGGVSHPSNPIDSAAEQRSRPWHTWRRAAQKVTRTWNEWQAANSRERTESYSRYISALAEEQLAASELQRTVSLAANAHDSADRIAPTAHSGENRELHS